MPHLVEFFEAVNEYVDQGDPIDVVYLDFQTAFVKSPASGALMKLGCHGIKEKSEISGSDIGLKIEIGGYKPSVFRIERSKQEGPPRICVGTGAV